MDVEEVCRSCLKREGPMHHLASLIQPKDPWSSSAYDRVTEIFMELLISYEDESPRQICLQCCDDIRKTYKFFKKCEKTTTVLKQKLEQIKLFMSSIDIIRAELSFDHVIENNSTKNNDTKNNSTKNNDTKNKCPRIEDKQNTIDSLVDTISEDSLLLKRKSVEQNKLNNTAKTISIESEIEMDDRNSVIEITIQQEILIENDQGEIEQSFQNKLDNSVQTIEMADQVAENNFFIKQEALTNNDEQNGIDSSFQMVPNNSEQTLVIVNQICNDELSKVREETRTTDQEDIENNERISKISDPNSDDTICTEEIVIVENDQDEIDNSNLIGSDNSTNDDDRSDVDMVCLENSSIAQNTKTKPLVIASKICNDELSTVIEEIHTENGQDKIEHTFQNKSDNSEQTLEMAGQIAENNFFIKQEVLTNNDQQDGTDISFQMVSNNSEQTLVIGNKICNGELSKVKEEILTIDQDLDSNESILAISDTSSDDTICTQQIVILENDQYEIDNSVQIESENSTKNVCASDDDYSDVDMVCLGNNSIAQNTKTKSDIKNTKRKFQNSEEYFACSGCSYSCLIESTLKNHIIANHVDLTFCKLCNEEFECSPDQHCLKHMSINCNIIDGSVDDNVIAPDTETICSEPFRYKLGLLNHKRTKNKSSESGDDLNSFKIIRQDLPECETELKTNDTAALKCSICSETFRYKLGVINHKRTKHKSELWNDSSSSKIDQQNMDVNQSGTKPNSICNQLLELDREFRNHV